jgi:hypothetical protein
MSLTFNEPFLWQLLEGLLYLTVSGAYASAFWAARRGVHIPAEAHLVTCVAHAVLGLLCWVASSRI